MNFLGGGVTSNFHLYAFKLTDSSVIEKKDFELNDQKFPGASSPYPISNCAPRPLLLKPPPSLNFQHPRRKIWKSIYALRFGHSNTIVRSRFPPFLDISSTMSVA